jgi:hypothetical protein
MSPEAAPEPRAHTHSLWFAGLVAAVSAPLAYWTVLIVIELSIGGGSVSEEIMRSLGFLAMVGVPVSLVVTFLLGCPLALALRKHGRLFALNLCAGALFIGAALAVLLAQSAFPSNAVDLALPALGAGTGLFAGIVFCLVAGIPFRRQAP